MASQKATTPSPLPADKVLEIAQSYCKPRISLSQMAKATTIKTQQNPKKPDDDFMDNTKRLLMIIIAVPFLPTSKYYDLLKLNYREGNAAKAEAVAKKLIIEHTFHSGKRGGKQVLLEPSKEAFDRFQLKPQYENPGFMHRFLQHQVKDAMVERGYKVTLEKCVKGKNIDVVLEKGNEAVAVEIAVTDKHEVVNVKKDILKAGFDQVVIIGKDKKVVSAVRKKIDAECTSQVASKVTCCVLADFIG